MRRHIHRLKQASWFNILIRTFDEFINDNALKFSASLSYYTIFSLAPLMMITISLCGFIFGADAVRGEIYGQISGLIGSEAAIQVQEMIRNVHISKDNTFTAIVGIVTLIIGASGVFVEIQDSINRIWGLKTKPNKGFVRLLMNRLISFSAVISLGFLMLVSLLLNAVMESLNTKLEKLFPQFSISLFYAMNLVMLFVIIVLLFAVIFKTLPDGRVAWKDTLIGSTFTAFLFMLGKSIIGFYLGNSKVLSIFGTAASVIVILLWVYYSAVILYFGAEFTKVYAYTSGSKIVPNFYAVHVSTLEVESKKTILHDPGIHPEVSKGDTSAPV